MAARGGESGSFGIGIGSAVGVGTAVGGLSRGGTEGTFGMGLKPSGIAGGEVHGLARGLVTESLGFSSGGLRRPSSYPVGFPGVGMGGPARLVMGPVPSLVPTSETEEARRRAAKAYNPLRHRR